jgi:hypothetical protein
MAAGRFDGDGADDLALAVRGQAADSTAVRLFLGGGMLADQGVVAVQRNRVPAWIAAGDVDGDARADLVLTTNAPNVPGRVSVLLGDGKGTFGSERIIDAAASNLEQALIADLDGDGRADVAATNGNQVAVSLGRGNGLLGAPKVVAAGAHKLAIAAGQLAGDGKPDLVVLEGGAAACDQRLLLLTNTSTP